MTMRESLKQWLNKSVPGAAEWVTVCEQLSSDVGVRSVCMKFAGDYESGKIAEEEFMASLSNTTGKTLDEIAMAIESPADTRGDVLHYARQIMDKLPLRLQTDVPVRVDNQYGGNAEYDRAEYIPGDKPDHPVREIVIGEGFTDADLYHEIAHVYLDDLFRDNPQRMYDELIKFARAMNTDHGTLQSRQFISDSEIQNIRCVLSVRTYTDARHCSKLAHELYAESLAKFLTGQTLPDNMRKLFTEEFEE